MGKTKRNKRVKSKGMSEHDNLPLLVKVLFFDFFREIPLSSSSWVLASIFSCPRILEALRLRNDRWLSAKKWNRPIFISQVEVTEYYLEMNFFCFSFALNQKYRAANFSRLIAAKSGRK